ncbi:hypothetical protein HK102_006525, partial [Quaeritorhiza haematococci]
QDSYSKAGALALQAFRSITTVLSLNGQPTESSRYKSHLLTASSFARRIAIINTIGVGIVTFCFTAVRSPVFYYGGVLVLDGKMGAGDAISTFLQIASGVMFLGNIIVYVQSTNEAQGAAQKVFSVIERTPTIDIASPHGKKLTTDDFEGGVEFKDVWFSYPSRPEYKVLKGFSLSVEPGRTVALVGPSGSGKSTVFQLLMRMYDPEEGEVLLDGTNAKDINLLSLRESMSIVSQEPVLFDATILENVALGTSSSITTLSPTSESLRSDIHNALEAANALEFVAKFPKGVDTRVTRGTTLSGGQKQRIAIARAIVRKPRVLMMDEATSALDSKSERIVQKALEKVSKNQTTLVIAHRLSTIKNADVIVVMDQGRVIETGTHDTLMAKQGLYHSMVRAQDMQHQQQKSPDSPLSPSSEEEEDEVVVGGDSRLLTTSVVDVDRYGDDEKGKSREDVVVVQIAVDGAVEETGETGSLRKRNIKSTTTSTGKDGAAEEEAGKKPEDEDEDEANMDPEKLKEKKKKTLEENEKKRLMSKPFPLGRMIQAARPDWGYVAIGLLGSLLDGTLVPLEASLMGINLAVYGNPAQFGGSSGVLLYSLLFLPLALLGLVAKSLQQYGFGISGARLTERMREWAFSRLIRLDMYFFDREENSPGALTARLASDADAIKRLGGPLAGQLVTVVVNSVLGLGIAFYAGWQLTLVMLGTAPLLFGATYLERKALEGYIEQTKKAYEGSGQLAAMVLANVKTVVMLAKERKFLEEYSKSLVAPHRLGYKKASAQALGNGAFQALMIVTFFIAFAFCYYLIQNQILAFSRIVIVILNVILTSVAAGALAANARNVTDAKIAANALFEIIDEKQPKIDIERHDPAVLREKRVGVGEAEVEVRGVEFAFPARNDIKVLKGVSIHIGRGEKVAIVGQSGSGKSTIASLVQRLYDPEAGSIHFCGTDLREWDLKVLRSQIGVVGQEPVLFDLTIEENIMYGCEGEVTRADVEEAARVAMIDEFVRSLPQGYETRVGEMGSRLSGGQKQRIAIARAIVRKPALLVLDEATR